ncbi:complement resistance protein TraT [Vibrio anguillarum]|uniref:Complement resistance protein TraT n=2 Tax=Vibrio anguillarum TaxID=55601 RepID=A0ABR9Z6R7_VIBAN|nr:complement resistance protein TraT [Vibrio anguillarum]MBF4374147.1 complement resistance protein TraT [Vibrio anguillarum]
MKRNKTTLIGLALASVMALSGCSAVTTAVKKRNLEVQTQMSETVWLDPVGADKRTVFVQVRNTTDKPIDIMDALSTKLSNKGYRVVQDPDAAHYWVQTNILKLDKMDLREAQGFLSSGYGAGISGAALGALATGAFTSHNNTLAAGGLIGATVGLVADAIVEDVNYAMITDVQIVEKTDQQVQTTEQANIKSGSSSSTQTTLTTLDNKKRFQTRILSNANQVNLEFEEAKPALVDGLTTSISGVF